SISQDDTQMRGSELASIAAEKAGIVKPGVPVVSGTTVPEARAVIERTCRERNAPHWQRGADFGYEYEAGKEDQEGSVPPRVRVLSTQYSVPSTRFSRHDRDVPPMYELGLLGEHQAANAAVAVAVVERLRAGGLHVPEGAVRTGLATVHWPARLEVVGRHPLVVLDCAHNVASASALVQTL